MEVLLGVGEVEQRGERQRHQPDAQKENVGKGEGAQHQRCNGARVSILSQDGDGDSVSGDPSQAQHPSEQRLDVETTLAGTFRFQRGLEQQGGAPVARIRGVCDVPHPNTKPSRYLWDKLLKIIFRCSNIHRRNENYDVL